MKGLAHMPICIPVGSVLRFDVSAMAKEAIDRRLRVITHKVDPKSERNAAS